MTLNKMMEDRQLNFNQPLLSVRRGSSMTSPPEVNKGRTQNSRPTLPPLPYYKSELKSGPVRNPGAVPFKWEQMPGRPKCESKAERDTTEPLPVAPKLPPGRSANHKQKVTDEVLKDSPSSSSRSQAENKMPSTLDNSSVDKVMSESEGSEKGTEDKDISSSEDEKETFLDARDTLSRTESFYNCSVSGVSRKDDQIIAASGAFSDPQTQDFMMGRFLPAAKAVASETPQYASRKHSVAKEQLKPVKKEIKWKKQSRQYKFVADTSPHNIHGEEEDDEEDKEDEFEETEDLSAKLCGLMPRFCLLNPLPGMRDHAQVISSVKSVRTRPAYAGTFRKSEKKNGTNNHKGELKRITPKHASANKSSMNGNFASKSIAPLKDQSPQSLLRTDKRFLGLSEEHRDLSANKLGLHYNGGLELKKFLGQQDAQEITCPANPAIEKTLYVDSEHVEQSRNSNSSSSESRGRNPSVDYSLQDMKSLCQINDKALSQFINSDIADSALVCTSDKSCQDVGEDLVKDLPKDQDLSLVVNVVQQPKSEDATQKSSLLVTLGPLLPKSPSESWLSRTLPTMSSSNPSSKSYLGNLAFRSSPVDPRRGRLVKASNAQHMLLWPAGELAPISEN